MKQFLILMTALALLSSCTSKSGQLVRRQRAARVQQLKATFSGGIYAEDVVRIRYVDTLYQAGDTIELGQAKYVVRAFAPQSTGHE